MFCESDEHHLYDGNEYNDDEDDDDGENSDDDREEIESALYAQIHFHHEEEGNLSYKGYSTSVQTREPTSVTHDDCQENRPSRSAPSGSVSTPISLLSSPSTCADNCAVSLSSDEESVYVVSDDSDFTDSECMILDEPLSDTEDIMVHVEKHQQPILQAALPTAATTENDVWKISEMDQTLQSSNPALKRYYNPISVRCHNCKEMGHISNVCPKPKKSEICHLCGMTGHFFRKCPEGICYNCEGPGHNSCDCPEQRKQRGQTCFRCLMPGHSKNTCPDIWRQFHVTTSDGPVQKMEMKQNPKRFCSNCASRKHFGFECVEDRMEWHEKGNYPFISTYTHRDKSSTRDKNSQIQLKPQKTKTTENQGSKNWDNMAASGSYRGTKRKYWEEPHTESAQGKRRKTPNELYRDEDTQIQPKAWQKNKNQKVGSRHWDNMATREETENYTGQGKQRKTQNKFNKGRNGYVGKNSWQAYNHPDKKDKTHNYDRGSKTSYNKNYNNARGSKTSYNKNYNNDRGSKTSYNKNYNNDRGSKTSYNKKHNYDRGFKTSFYEN